MKKIIKNAFLIDDELVLKQILALASAVEFSKNEIILSIGEKQEDIYIIIQGVVRSFYLDIEGNDVTKMFMKENDFCVGESLFEQENSIQGFEALEVVKALKFNANELKKIILANKQLTSIYINYLEQNLIYKMQRESSFQLMSATQRYLKFHQEYQAIENRVNQSYIASYLGIAPESLSRIKKAVKKEN